MTEFIVYMASNTVNGKRYIGATSRGLAVRRSKHLSDAKAARPGCRVFNAAIRKYGADAFTWSILATISSHDDMMIEEVRLIREIAPEYNITRGGNGVIGVPRTPEWTEKIARALRGRKMSPERIAAMKASARPDKLFKPVVCLNDGNYFKSVKDAAQHYGIGKNNIGGMLSGEHTQCKGLSFVFSNREMTAEERKVNLGTLEARRVAWNVRRNADKRRSVICLTDDELYESGRAAAKYYDITPARVMQLCQSGGQTLAGLSFRYADSPAVVKRERTEAERETQRRGNLAGLARGRLKIQKRVVLVESGEIFDSIADAARRYRLNEKQLYQCIKFGYDYWGYTFRLLDADGNPVVVPSRRKKLRKVICIDEMVISAGVDTAARRHGVSRSTLAKLCERNDDSVVLGTHRFSFLDQWCENAA